MNLSLNCFVFDCLFVLSDSLFCFVFCWKDKKDMPKSKRESVGKEVACQNSSKTPKEAVTKKRNVPMSATYCARILYQAILCGAERVPDYLSEYRPVLTALNVFKAMGIIKVEDGKITLTDEHKENIRRRTNAVPLMLAEQASSVGVPLEGKTFDTVRSYPAVPVVTVPEEPKDGVQFLGDENDQVNVLTTNEVTPAVSSTQTPNWGTEEMESSQNAANNFPGSDRMPSFDSSPCEPFVLDDDFLPDEHFHRDDPLGSLGSLGSPLPGQDVDELFNSDREDFFYWNF